MCRELHKTPLTTFVHLQVLRQFPFLTHENRIHPLELVPLPPMHGMNNGDASLSL
jgi:hypothetical protein